MTRDEAIEKLKECRPQHADAMEWSRSQDDTQPPCAGCGGPYFFDTSIPNVVWNTVVRSRGGPEFLCLNCILSIFVKAGVSFTAELFGDGLSGVPIEVRINNESAQDASKIQDENNALRNQLTTCQQEVERLRRQEQWTFDVATGKRSIFGSVNRAS